MSVFEYDIGYILTYKIFMAKITETKRYKENPFLNVYSIPRKDKKIIVMGASDNVLVNQHTGEVQGTQIVSYRKVDSDKFVKLFAQNIGLTFDLSSYGIRAFNVLLWTIQYKALGKDVVLLDKYNLIDFLNAENKKFDYANFRKGLSELEKAKIIAKSIRPGDYFINPHFCFNGDRIAFTTVIERKKKTDYEKLEELGQQRLIE